MKCNIFVYGRTKNEDYRWLQKPNIAINSNFFARVIEENSNSLKKDEKLFIFVATPDLYMLAYIFKDFSSIDERGRPISFVIGITCDSLEGREFNYRLPALLQQHHLITKLIKNDLEQVINTNSSFNIKNFDISQVNYIMNQELVASFHHNTTVNSSILEVAQNLNNQISTPNLESNFKVTEFNNLLKNENKEKRDSFLNNNFNREDKESSILKIKVAEELNINNKINSNSKIIINNKSKKEKEKEKEKNKVNNSLINQLNNFEKDEKDTIISQDNDLNEVIKFKSAYYLKECYENKRRKGFFETKSQVIFKYQDINELYKKLIIYDEKIVQIIEKYK